MNEYKIVFQDNALDDAKRIKAYIKYTLLNFNAAEKFSDLLERRLSKISGNPYIYPTDKFGKNIYHYAMVNKYMIVFRIDERDKTIYILAIGHSLQKRNNITKGR